MLNRRCANEYNSLADSHLQAYFSNRNLLRHLRKAGLINKKKEIVPEATYRANINRAEQKQEVKEALAQAIVHKSLDLQLKRESEIQKRLEEIAKLELVKKIRSERLQRKTQSTPSSRIGSGQHPAWKYFTLSPDKQDTFPASRPRTAHRRQFMRDSTSLTSVETASYTDSYSESTATSLRESETLLKHASGDAGIRSHLRKSDKDLLKKCGQSFTKYDQEKLKLSPYLYSVPGSEKRLLKISDIPNGARWAYHPPESMASRRTNCLVTLKYLGTGANISWEEPTPGTEVIIQQQHCGGNTLCVYRGHHKTQEEFSFVSHRHLNFPFSLSIYLAGILYLRVSACCEYRHRKGTRLGGPQGLFSLVNVQGASPCARCLLNRQMNEEKKRKKKKSNGPTSADDQTKEELTVSPVTAIQSVKEQKEGSEREDNAEEEEEDAENQKEATEPEEKEAQPEPILFTVSGTVINVEDSNSEEEDDYQDDFEDEEEEKEVRKDKKKREETNNKEEEDKEVVKEKDKDQVNDETSSHGSKGKVSSEEDEEVGSKTADKKEEVGELVVKEKDADSIKDESSSSSSSSESAEKVSSEEDDDYEDDFHQDEEVGEENQEIPGKNQEVADTEVKANKQADAAENLSLDKSDKEKDNNESISPEDNTENLKEKKNEELVEDLKNKEKVLRRSSVLVQENVSETPREESDHDGRSDSNSLKESSSSTPSPPPPPRRKSKMKPEKRFRANNRNKTPSSSSSESDSIAHLPAEIEGTPKAKNWVPANPQETI